MTLTAEAPSRPSTAGPQGAVPCSGARAAAGNVWLCDPFCFTPWYTAELALALSRAGIVVDLRSAEFTREPGYFSGLGLHPHAGPLQLSSHLRRAPALCTRALRTAEVLLHYRALAWAMRRRAVAPAVLHLQQTPLLSHGHRADLRLIAEARACGVPVVHTVHNVLPHDSGDRRRSIYGELYRAADHLICHSADAAHAVAELAGVPMDRISVIPHGPLFAPRTLHTQADLRAARETLGLPLHRFIVLCQGILAPYKGLDVLLDAWSLCLDHCRRQGIPLPLLVVAGSGPAKLVAEVRARVLPLSDSVRADLAYLPTAQLPRYFAAANTFVYPYRRITTSGALLSGLSYHKPIVASDLPAFAGYLAHRENALLTPPGDAASLAESLFTLARDYAAHQAAGFSAPNGSTLARLAAGARRNDARCTSWTEIGERTAALYRQLTLQTGKRYCD